MFRFLAPILCGFSLSAAFALEAQTNSDKIASTRDFSELKREVETLRGKKFKIPVPVYQVTPKELRAISDREIDKQYPGAKLAEYEELLAWLDIIPFHTRLKSAYADFYVDQVAGLYDSDTKEMCLPSAPPTPANPRKKAAEKKLEQLTPELDDIVLAHEFTHALEDQYWPLDVPEDDDPKKSTDRDTAHSFVAEGSATREMIEAIPAQWGGESPRSYFLFWNLIHSGLGEFALNLAMADTWKSREALTAGMPPALAREESMPYSFGYTFCTKIMRDWGLDGLDYIYDHPPISSAQVMHPAKSWEWRDLPVHIDFPEKIGSANQVSVDCLGEAGIAVLLGCQFTNLNYGLRLARGWNGDRVAMYKSSGLHPIVVWASSWDSAEAAKTFARAWLHERKLIHQADIHTIGPDQTEWKTAAGRAGVVFLDLQRVIVVEADSLESLGDVPSIAHKIVFEKPPEDAVRARENPLFRRFNPIVAYQKDVDYAVTRSLGGLLSRHDRNHIGAADSFGLGLLGESRRTDSFNKWELVAGLLAKHESEARRGTSHTTFLPWGILASESSARLPQTPGKTVARASLVWGLGASATIDGANKTVHLLPFGLLLSRTLGPAQASFYILGTGYARKEMANHTRIFERIRVLGISVWTNHGSSKNPGRARLSPC